MITKSCSSKKRHRIVFTVFVAFFRNSSLIIVINRLDTWSRSLWVGEDHKLGIPHSRKQFALSSLCSYGRSVEEKLQRQNQNLRSRQTDPVRSIYLVWTETSVSLVSFVPHGIVAGEILSYQKKKDSQYLISRQCSKRKCLRIMWSSWSLDRKRKRHPWQLIASIFRADFLYFRCLRSTIPHKA